MLKRLKEFNTNPDHLYDYLYQSIISRAENYGRIPQNITKSRTKKILNQYELDKTNTGSPADYPKNEAINWINSLPERLRENSSLVKEIINKHKLNLEDFK